jgi:hypothetical protein
MEKYKIECNSQLFQRLINNDKEHLINPVNNKNQNNFLLLIESVLKYKIEIKNSWLNKTIFKNVDNSFPWHNEKGIGNKTIMPGSYSGIIWIYGKEDSGGSLDILNKNGDIINTPFEIGSFIIFESNCLHRVNHYYGSVPRISLNISFDKI